MLALTGAALATPAAAQQDMDARIAALEQQLAALSQELAALKAQQAAVASAPPVAPASQPATPLPAPAVVSIESGKPIIASQDGAFAVQLHGVLQFDLATYRQDSGLSSSIPAVARDLNDGSNVRRGRIGVSGVAFTDFDYSLLFEFGGSGADGPGKLWESYLQYRGLSLAGRPLTLRAGVFAPNLGLEDASSTNGSMFLERPSASDIARSLAGADQRNGFEVTTDGRRWMAAVAVTGAKAGDSQTFDEQLAYTGRIAGEPLSGEGWRLHLGLNASYVARPPEASPGSPEAFITFQDRPELRVDGTRLVSTGAIDAESASHVGAELALQTGRLLVQSEYFRFNIRRRAPAAGVDDPFFNGWYLEGGWILTGAPRRYVIAKAGFDAPGVPRPFDLARKEWGTWELVARYSVIDLNFRPGAAGSIAAADAVRGGEQTVSAFGVNWFLNPEVKLALQYQQVHIDRLDATGADIGQTFNALAMRTQLAF